MSDANGSPLQARATDSACDAANGEVCAICGRQAPLTRHHLVPRALHKRLKRRAAFAGRDLSATIGLCRACHSTLHQTFSEKELAVSYDSLESILADGCIARWREWLAAKPDGFAPRLRSWTKAPHRAR
ncbi:hypothetical protein [Desulfovibrio sp. X2]|uniref:hypothetical protein n=1 Tax=Desulfovibrio sp. X2 TaxID=941449 RepID=UPI001F312DEA|nr:hypothetical protein [Desulfovibrio sp. X2]